MWRNCQNIRKTGEVWRQEKRKKGKRDVIHHIRDEIDIPENLSPIQLVDDEEKIELVDDEKEDENVEKIIQDEDIPNHGHWPIHQDEYKTCRVFSNCNKEYSKQNLLDLAVKCGVNIYQRGKKTKTKVQLCNALRRNMELKRNRNLIVG